MFMRKDGEKVALLNRCGELLFGCSGQVLVTQGIYIPKLLSSDSHSFICKRTVWVPTSLSHGHLVHNLESFGATLPFSVERVAFLHRFGLCGISPTRTGHTAEKAFLLLARVPHKHFAIYGIVEIRQTCATSLAFIEAISTNGTDILNCVEWIQSEIALYHLVKESKSKRKRRVSTVVKRNQEGQVVEGVSTISTIPQGAEQHPFQHKSDKTDSDLSANTSEHPSHPPQEQVNPPSVSSNCPQVTNSNTIFWISCLPPQYTSEVSCSQDPHFTT